MIDYVLHLKSKRGNLNEKVFKIKKITLKKDESIKIHKKHPLKVMSTKVLYPGIQKLELQINGKRQQSADFEIII